MKPIATNSNYKAAILALPTTDESSFIALAADVPETINIPKGATIAVIDCGSNVFVKANDNTFVRPLVSGAANGARISPTEWAFRDGDTTLTFVTQIPSNVMVAWYG